jgi:hypothetical protein
MLTKLGKLFRSVESEVVVVRFEGGMGTQIFQAATLMHLRDLGQISGQLTHWHYQLDHFNLPMSSFPSLNPLGRDKRPTHCISKIYSEFELAQLGYSALRKSSISAKFPLSQNVGKHIDVELLQSSVCLHIRRGDYVNVASRLTSLEEFYVAARALSGLSNCLVLFSDSPLEESTTKIFKKFYEKIYIFDEIPAEVSHDMMRLAKAIICSNSTFSLTAALLGRAQAVLLPKRWYEGKAAPLNDAIGQLSDWQLMNQ